MLYNIHILYCTPKNNIKVDYIDQRKCMDKDQMLFQIKEDQLCLFPQNQVKQLSEKIQKEKNNSAKMLTVIYPNHKKNRIQKNYNQQLIFRSAKSINIEGVQSIDQRCSQSCSKCYIFIYSKRFIYIKSLVKQLLQSPKWSKVQCIVRRTPQQWKNIQNKDKLHVRLQENMDTIFQTNKWKFQGIDAAFCCLGIQIKNGEQMFTKIDKLYPLAFADIAIQNKIPHYLLVSAVGVDQNAFFMYNRIKGEAQRDLKLKKLNVLTITRPGLIANRTDERMVEKIFNWVPFIPKIQCSDLAKCLMLRAEEKAAQSRKLQGFCQTLQNCDMLKILEANKKK